MIKLLNNQDDSIKYFTNGGRSNYYFINSKYLRDMTKNNISLIKLEFNLIYRTLVITDLSLAKICAVMGLLIDIFVFYTAQDIVSNYPSAPVFAAFVIFWVFDSMMSLAFLYILSILSNLSNILKQLYLFIKFNIMNFKSSK